MIISASRRTDIPAFYADWLINRLKAGTVLLRNPYNPKNISQITFDRESVDCIVFWTKNAQPMLSRLKLIDAMGYPYYFQFTITPYEKQIEKNLPDKPAVMDTFRKLSSLLGPKRVIWRYDPIIVSQEYSAEYHLDKFGSMCKILGSYTEQCVFSFIELYSKIRRNVQELAGKPVSLADRHKITQGFAKIALEYRLDLATCCESADFSRYDIKKADCIDRKLIEEIAGCSLKPLKDTHQRPACNCLKSIDIGAYDCCPHGCIYCYATSNTGRVQANMRSHEPSAAILTGKVEHERVIIKAGESLKQLQTVLF